MEIKNKYKHLNSIYREIAEEFGIEVAKKFHHSFKGLQINFPISFTNKEFIINQIKNDYNGRNLKQLALKYSYSERWIRKILNKSTNDNL